jgi:hypothetical protein
MASIDVHELQTQQEGAAAAVAALYFCCLAGTAFNLRLTGFKLYIPISIAATGRQAVLLHLLMQPCQAASQQTDPSLLRRSFGSSSSILRS